MANVINYHYSPEDERWIEGLAVWDKIDRSNNQEKIYISQTPNEIYIKTPNGERKILDITNPDNIKSRSYENIVLKPGEYSFLPNGLHESFDDLEYLLKMIIPEGSLEKFREILGALMFPMNDKPVVLNFILPGGNCRDPGSTTRKDLIKRLKLIFELLQFGMQNFIDFTETGGTYSVQVTKNKWHRRLMIHRKKIFGWDIKYIFKNWYCVDELNNNTNQRLVMLSNDKYRGCIHKRRLLNKCSEDGLARQFRYDTFIEEYIRQIKPKPVFKYFGVSPIRVVKCNAMLPTIVSFTHDTPLATLKKFKVFTFQLKIANNYFKKKFFDGIRILSDKLHRWVLNGIILKRRKSARENIGFIKSILADPPGNKADSLVEEIQPPRMYFISPNCASRSTAQLDG